ncbi:hypothetical protein L13192_12406 [Pyrenophora tritici-repentis]|uniref:Uncharacterized protein n=1 Tax=Pyrenophora tritici-repentis TaxID=45151 RepID=A0A922NGY1_9PLEO|nr:hypothetical protein Ptr86124_005778 [Pyrenophora tritici-repentis]KAI1663451.1 hypothetical protein L13192_12406 [Pyrenophora tritici-repentis]KAI1684401.1 hypothetical protein KJE20_06906 [Pyrenophora tritici-repentis]
MSDSSQRFKTQESWAGGDGRRDGSSWPWDGSWMNGRHGQGEGESRLASDDAPKLKLKLRLTPLLPAFCFCARHRRRGPSALTGRSNPARAELRRGYQEIICTVRWKTRNSREQERYKASHISPSSYRLVTRILPATCTTLLPQLSAAHANIYLRTRWSPQALEPQRLPAYLVIATAQLLTIRAITTCMCRAAAGLKSVSALTVMHARTCIASASPPIAHTPAHATLDILQLLQHPRLELADDYS